MISSIVLIVYRQLKNRILLEHVHNYVGPMTARHCLVFVTRHAKRYKLGGRRHFEKMRLKVHIASHINSTPKRVSKRSFIIKPDQSVFHV